MRRALELAVVMTLAAGCGVDLTPADVTARRDAVVGGGPEARYPAVGYFMTGDSTDFLYGPYCGATLIAPNLAVTAGHCVDRSPAHGVALGPDALRFAAKEVVVHPHFDTRDRFQHDMALVVLASPPPASSRPSSRGRPAAPRTATSAMGASRRAT